jgi:uncharacterized membrane protein
VSRDELRTLGGFAAVHAALFGIVFERLYSMPSSGVGLFFDYASRVLDGQLPYRDFSLEYPPFALVFFILPRLITRTFFAYAVAYRVEVLACDLVALAILLAIARERGIRPWTLLASYTVCLIAIGPIVREQYDLFPAVLCLAAVYWFARQRHATSWIVLTLGALTKVYPVLLAPLFLLVHLRRRDGAAVLRAAVGAAGVSVAVLSPWLLAAPASLERLYAYHAQRGLQVESTYASLLFFAPKLGLLHLGREFAFGSWNLTGPVPNACAAAASAVMVVSLAAVYAWAYQRIGTARPDILLMGSLTLVVLLAGLLTSKVLSPQYLLWLLPFVPLATVRRPAVLWLFVVAAALTYYVFPEHYGDLIRGSTNAIVALLVRNVLLLVTAIGIVTASAPHTSLGFRTWPGTSR